ncbi:MAG TPA: ATP-binding protein [Anaerolineales bacterium]|nr:ATP-binding protein [Anaerolineales bacterium]
MLEYLRLKNAGPAPEMELSLAPRLNLITGDNGLGKSFLLDVAWWALTRRWPHDLNPMLTSGYPARPVSAKKEASIEFKLTSKAKSVVYQSHYEPREESWIGKAGRPWNPGLVIYVHADGGFSVWDPARNYWKKKGNVDVQERLPGFVFSANDVWDGLEVKLERSSTIVCNGLLSDWANWIREKGLNAKRMTTVLKQLSPEGESLRPGRLMRLSVNDARDIPSIRTSYADSIPILHASAGVKRIVGLAYMLLWSWNEHSIAAKLLGERPTSQVVLLFDEIESHLHPKWQRSILKSVLEITNSLHVEAKVQLIAATHSPLILASAEPTFNAKRDAWFDLDMEAGTLGKTVVLRKRDFVILGDVSRWLTSEAFDLKEARSKEAEEAISTALEVLKKPKPTRAEIQRADHLLRSSLGDMDRFWVRWSNFTENIHA